MNCKKEKAMKTMDSLELLAKTPYFEPDCINATINLTSNLKEIYNSHKINKSHSKTTFHAANETHVVQINS